LQVPISKRSDRHLAAAGTVQVGPARAGGAGSAGAECAVMECGSLKTELPIPRRCLPEHGPSRCAVNEWGNPLPT